MPRPLLVALLLVALFVPCLSRASELDRTRDLMPSEQLAQMRSEARVALVIGNGAYRTAPLGNSVSDARAVATALRQVGFAVTFGRDLDNIGMKKALAAFGRQLEAGGVGLFYYAGHGLQRGGTNYLVPVDAELNRPDDLEIYGIQADAVLARMESAGNRVNIVILDACRNDPFSRGGGGLAMMDARGTLLAYASGAGRVATDDGVYARALVHHMQEPGATIEEVFKRVGKEVEEVSGGNQSPWIGSNLRGDFYFVLPEPQPVQTHAEVQEPVAREPAPAASPVAAPASQVPAANIEPRSRARRGWFEVSPQLGYGHDPYARRWIGSLDLAARLGERFALEGTLLYSPDLGANDIKHRVEEMLIDDNKEGDVDSAYQVPVNKLIMSLGIGGRFALLRRSVTLPGSRPAELTLTGMGGLGLLSLAEYYATYNEEWTGSGESPVSLMRSMSKYTIPVQLGLGADLYFGHSMSLRFDLRSLCYLGQEPDFDPGDTEELGTQLYAEVIGTIGVGFSLPRRR